MSPGGPKTPPPEEKLLRLIRGAPALAAPRAAPASPKAAPLAGGRLSGVWRLPAWWLTAFNVGLGCLIAGEAIVLTLTMSTSEPPPSAPAAPAHAVPSKQPPPSVAAPAQEPDSAAPSLAAVATGSLFQSRADATGVTSKMAAPTTSSEARVLASLNLIGIVSGEPAQAIVEDTQTKKTYFVKVGQHVVEGLIVQDIREDRIILDLHGEYIELSL